MLVDIDRVTVNNRIRKDFGNIEELAEDIKRNNLLNPPICIPESDGTFTLLAGERRLRAMRLLGWKQVEIRTWTKLDDADKLEVEISENEQRKDFTPRERYEMFERRHAYLKENVHSSARKPVEQAAVDAGIGRNEVPKVREILAHESELDPELIKDWDDGKLSTAKLYRDLKKRLHDAEIENSQLRNWNADLEEAVKEMQEEVEDDAAARLAAMREKPDEYAQIDKLEKDKELLQSMLDKLTEQSKTERASLKSQLTELSGRYNEKLMELRDEREKRKAELELASRPVSTEISRDALFFADRCADFLKKVGGYAYLASRLNELSDEEKANIRNGAINVFAWAQNTLESMEGIRDAE